MYPRVIIDSQKYRHNVVQMKTLLETQGVELIPVTKGFCAWPELVGVIEQEGIERVADSRLENFEAMGETKLKKLMLRLPMLSQIERLVRHTDLCLVSERVAIEAIDAEALKQDKDYDMILMIDLGDLREGLLEEQVDAFFQELKPLQRAHLSGIGVNLTCFGGVIPEVETLNRLLAIRAHIQSTYGYTLDVVSGGNSSSVYLAMQHKLPQGVNMLRIGETLALGTESSYGEVLPGYHTDVFTLEAELIEVRRKPSKPWGLIGMDAFGEVPNHEDLGPMLRGILAIGRQDVSFEKLKPRQDIQLLGSSSDHLIVDLHEGAYKVGDILQFDVSYGSMLQLMTSPYVKKETI